MMKVINYFLMMAIFSTMVHADYSEMDEWEIIEKPKVRDENDFQELAPKQYNFFLNRWMQELGPVIEDKKLRELFIPGTHDTATSSISSESDVNPKCSIGQKLAPLRIFGVHGFITRWSKAQDLNITEQLDVGVRYLDLRLAYHPKHKTFWTEHCLFSQPFEEVLLEIKGFLKKNRKEILIIDVQNIDVGGGRIEQIQDMVHETFSQDDAKYPINFLIKEDLKKPIKKLWEENKQIVLIVDSDHTFKQGDKPDPHFLDRKTYLESKWHDAGTFKEFYEKSSEYLRGYFDPTWHKPEEFQKLSEKQYESIRPLLRNTFEAGNNKLFVMQAQLTPSTQVLLDYFKNPFKNWGSLEEIARDFNKVAVEKFDEWKKLTKGAIIIMDFMDANYAKLIIDLNFSNTQRK
ncbi:MAG: phosphatidylinositol-specific phospholipase C domain-containing protein [Alphaproteobacteria bacterium]|nr:phosphatidylinositol-specific phospholipase C domain-containing protein [Alphaproteobacteria bacterium]